ncbi:MAG: cytochrome b/b6 domain-containing protein [Hyphomicrobiales bacterium]
MLNPQRNPSAPEISVWDPFVRVFHWTVVVAFTVAYLTEDDTLTVHVWAGYLVGILVVARVLWGFVGPQHARFTDFVYAPATAFAYVRDLLRFRGRRYLGHSPGGGYMVVVLLSSWPRRSSPALWSMAAISRRGRLPACSPRSLASPSRRSTKSSPTSRSR